MRMGPYSMLPSDRDAVKDARFSSGGLRRVWTFARPYRRSIFGFLAKNNFALLQAVFKSAGAQYIVNTKKSH